MAPQPDYFALYGISPTLSPDAAQLRKKYYELSRLYHPDRIATSETATQTAALSMSAQVNEAYRILTDDDALLGYVLRQTAVLEADEQYKLPPDFLMEMMELNEAVGNVAMAPDMSGDAQQEFDSALNAWQEGFGPLKAQFNKGDNSPQLLAKLKDYYFRKKYLLRIKERLV